MKDVIHKYMKEEPADEPVFLVFINDGGCKSGIKKIIANSSKMPICWQFVGIGDSNFDVLRKLDTMEGRYVDNANFFHLNNLEYVSDEEKRISTMVRGSKAKEDLEIIHSKALYFLKNDDSL